MFYTLSSRESILGQFPKGGAGAEIGVAEGNYSELILRDAQPRELHLIDPWSHLESADLLEGSGLLQRVTAAGAAVRDEATPENRPGDDLFNGVRARFAADRRVVLHRQYSYKAVQAFADRSLDFVYIDGNHNYEFVLRDLQDFSRKLAPGGLLFGHDFFEDDFARENDYGVIPAVQSFLKRSQFRLFMLTWEPFSTYCLADRLDGFAGEFLRNCLESELPMIELPDGVAFNYRDRMHMRKSGTARRIPSFAIQGDQR